MKTLTCLVLFAVLLQSHSVHSKRYLFQKAKISIKRYHEPWRKNETFMRVTNLDQHLFSTATKIKVQTNTMFELYKGAVQNLPYLKSLRLRECGIKVLEPKCFRNLPQLERLSLAENDLNEIKEGVFNDLPIKELLLNKNEITTIRSGAFDNMPNLELIKLNENLISEWDPRWFANSPRVAEIYFRRNKLKELPAKAFVNFKGSHFVFNETVVNTKILMSGNEISYVHPKAFHDLDSLDVVNLSKNKLKDFNWGMFSHMNELHELNLRRNSLEKIDSDAFDNLNELVVLDLSHNFFECVPYKVVKKVNKVDLRKNRKLDCDCISNLEEKLEEDNIKHKIEIDDLC